MFPVNNQDDRQSYRLDIDGLRALAVLLVVVNHLLPESLPHGYLGVDVFFVISGYVITLSSYKHNSHSLLKFISGFYKRRIARIVPTLFIYLAVFSLFITIIDPEPLTDLKTALSSALGLSNIYLSNNDLSYFSQDANFNPFTQTWSLSVEEQFYFLFPFVLFYSTNGKLPRKFLLLSTIVIFSCSFYMYISYNMSSTFNYYSTLPRVWELCLGILAFSLTTVTKKILKPILPWMHTALIGILIALFFLPATSVYFLRIAILITVFLILVFECNSSIGYKILTSPPCIYLAKISYPVYLWHWGILTAFYWIFGSISLLSSLFVLVLTISISNLNYIYVETKLRASLIKFSELTIFPSFIFLLGIVVTSLFTLIRFYPLLYNFPLAYTSGIRLKEYFISFNRLTCQSKNITNACLIEPVGQNNNNSKNMPRIALLGDSHAWQITPLIQNIHSVYNTGYFVSTNGLTPEVVSINNYMGSNKVQLPYKGDQYEFINSVVNQLSKKGVIILSSFWDFRFSSKKYALIHSSTSTTFFNKRGEIISEGDALKGWFKDLAYFASIAKTKDQSILVVLPIPYFKGSLDAPHPLLCIPSAFRILPPKCGKPDFADSSVLLDRTKIFRNSLKELLDSHTNIYIHDAFKDLCPGEVCSNIMNGDAIYLDDNHINSNGLDKISQKLEKSIINRLDL